MQERALSKSISFHCAELQACMADPNCDEAKKLDSLGAALLNRRAPLVTSPSKEASSTHA